MSAAAAGLEEDRRLVEELRARAEGYKRDGAHMAATPLEDAADRLAAALDERDKLVSAVQAGDDLLRRLSEWNMLSTSLDGKPATGDGPYWQREIARVRAALSAARPSVEGRQAPE